MLVVDAAEHAPSLRLELSKLIQQEAAKFFWRRGSNGGQRIGQVINSPLCAWDCSPQRDAVHALLFAVALVAD